MKQRYSTFFLLIVSLNCWAFDFVSNKTSNGSLSTIFMKDFVELFHPDILIETGTYSGETAANMAPFFKHVHTVELSTELYEKAKKFLDSVTNVTAYCGNSARLLQTIIPQCKGTILLWLDAHYSGGKTVFSNDDHNCGSAVTAIREELDAIAKTGRTDCIILVDDMRGFGSTIKGTEFLGCWAYPSIQEVCACGRAINKNFEFALLGDSLLMYDATKFKPVFSPIVKACTMSRLYDGKNYSEKQLRKAEQIIMTAANPQERAFIKELYEAMTSYKDPLFHHDLWYALTCIGSSQWAEAQAALRKVPTRVEYFNKNRQAVNNIVRYSPARFSGYFEAIRRGLQ